MATYVLVPGMWLDGLSWADVTTRLRAADHTVYPVTLTGLGDRAHLGGPEVDLDTHIADIVRTIEAADLRDVILVGHSYGGFPVTGAAGRVRDRLRRLVYIESGPAPDGVCQLALTEPEQQERTRRAAAEHGDGWPVPVPTWSELGGPDGAAITGLGPAERARFERHATPHPLGSVSQPLHDTDGTTDGIPHTLVTCMFSRDQVRAMISAGHPYFAAFGGKEWSFVEVRTGHWPMFSAPDALADRLAELGG